LTTNASIRTTQFVLLTTTSNLSPHIVDLQFLCDMEITNEPKVHVPEKISPDAGPQEMAQDRMQQGSELITKLRADDPKSHWALMTPTEYVPTVHFSGA
jgi:hypothetical protein